MKTTLTLLLASALTASAAVTMDMTFTGAAIGTPVDGYDGWTQSEPNSAPNAPLSWVGIHAGEKAAAIGGWFDEPTGPKLSIEHDVGAALEGAQVTLNFGIFPSTPNYPDQNDFSVVFVDSTLGDVFSMDFTGAVSQWNVGWSSSLAGSQPPFAGVLPMGRYSYTFNAIGNDVHYSIYGPSNSVAGSSNIPGLATANFDSIRIDWLKGGKPGWGDNFFSLSSASVCANNIPTPEPDSLAIVAGMLCAAMFMRSRRTNL